MAFPGLKKILRGAPKLTKDAPVTHKPLPEGWADFLGMEFNFSNEINLNFEQTISLLTEVKTQTLNNTSLVTFVKQAVDSGSLSPAEIRKLMESVIEAYGKKISLDKTPEVYHQLTEEKGDTIRQQAASTKHFLDIYFGSELDKAGIVDPNKLRLTAKGIESEINSIKAEIKKNGEAIEAVKKLVELTKAQAEQNNTLGQSINAAVGNGVGLVNKCLDKVNQIAEKAGQIFNRVRDIFVMIPRLFEFTHNILGRYMTQIFPVPSSWGSSREIRFGPTDDFKTDLSSFGKMTFEFTPSDDNRTPQSSIDVSYDGVMGIPNTVMNMTSQGNISLKWEAGFSTGAFGYFSPYDKDKVLWPVTWDLPQVLGGYYFPAYHGPVNK